MFPVAPREAQTSLKCPLCSDNLKIRRSCGEVWLECPRCGEKFALKDFIAKADPAMEAFLENLYVDRI